MLVTSLGNGRSVLQCQTPGLSLIHTAMSESLHHPPQHCAMPCPHGTVKMRSVFYEPHMVLHGLRRLSMRAWCFVQWTVSGVNSQARVQRERTRNAKPHAAQSAVTGRTHLSDTVWTHSRHIPKPSVSTGDKQFQ